MLHSWRDRMFKTTVDELLEKETTQLTDLLEESDLLQECKYLNAKLLDFLTRPENLVALCTYISQPQPQTGDNTVMKYPYVACEILCSEVSTIVDAIFAQQEHQQIPASELPVSEVNGEEGNSEEAVAAPTVYVRYPLLDMVFSYVSAEPPLPLEQANYCARVCQSFLQKRTIETLDFLKSKPDFVQNLVRNLSHAPTLEFLIKFIRLEESTESCGAVQWLCDCSLVDHLTSLFFPQQSNEVYEVASQALSDIIVAASNASSPSLIIYQLQTDEIAAKYFDLILCEQATGGGGVTYGLPPMTLLFTLLSATTLETMTPLNDLPGLFHTVIAYYGRFSQLLEMETEQIEGSFTAITPYEAQLIQPLGLSKLRICEFISAFLRTNFACVMDTFINAPILPTILDLFFKYHWHSLLHYSVLEMLSGLLNSQHPDLICHVLQDCRFLARILEVERENAIEEEQTGFSRGYMGTVTKLATAINYLASSEEYEIAPRIFQILSETEGWDIYTNGILATRQRKEAGLLGGRRPVPLPPHRIDENGSVIPLPPGAQPENGVDSFAGTQFEQDNFQEPVA